jgi:hypothetical protein
MSAFWRAAYVACPYFAAQQHSSFTPACAHCRMFAFRRSFQAHVALLLAPLLRSTGGNCGRHAGPDSEPRHAAARPSAVHALPPRVFLARSRSSSSRDCLMPSRPRRWVFVNGVVIARMPNASPYTGAEHTHALAAPSARMQSRLGLLPQPSVPRMTLLLHLVTDPFSSS